MKLSYNDIIAIHPHLAIRGAIYHESADLLNVSFNGGLIAYIAPNYVQGHTDEIKIAHSTMGIMSFTTVKMDDKVFEIVEK